MGQACMWRHGLHIAHTSCPQAKLLVRRVGRPSSTQECSSSSHLGERTALPSVHHAQQLRDPQAAAEGGNPGVAAGEGAAGGRQRLGGRVKRWNQNPSGSGRQHHQQACHHQHHLRVSAALRAPTKAPSRSRWKRMTGASSRRRRDSFGRPAEHSEHNEQQPLLPGEQH